MHAVTRWIRLGTLAALAAGTPLAVQAQSWMSTATIDASQEPPPPPRVSPALGFGKVTLDVNANMLYVFETWSGLTANNTGAHIHCCTVVGGTAPVAIDFVPNGFPVGTTAGAYDHVFNLLSASTYGTQFLGLVSNDVVAARNTFVTGFLAGQSYLNIHTSTYPAGEIRGNLVSVTATPEPATYALMATGLGVLGLVGRRRRRA